MPWNVEHAAQWIAGALVSRHFTKDRIWLRQSNFSSQLVQGQSAVRHNGGGPGVVRATPGTQWWQTTSTHQRHQWPFRVITTFLQPDCWTKASRQGAQEKREDSKGQATVVRDPAGFYRVFNCILGRRSRRPTRTRTANSGTSGANSRGRRKRDPKGKRRWQNDSKPIADNSPLLMFEYLV